MSALVTPPGQSPDEPAHMGRAAGLLHGAILGVRRTDIDPNTGKAQLDTGVKADYGLYLSAWGKYSVIAERNVVTTPDFIATRAQPRDHTKTALHLPNTATYFPAAYLPATLGMAIGLATREPPFACFLLARIFMLAAFLALGVIAIRIAAYGEALLLTVLILPMTLFLAGSINQDGILTAMACLACAALTRNSTPFRVLGLVVFVIFLGAKPPYILMLCAFLLPLFGIGFWRRVRDVAIACVPVLIWVALISAFVIVPYLKGLYHPGPLYTGDRSVFIDHTNAAANLHILLAHPSRLITFPWLGEQIPYWLLLHEMIGVLGLLDIVLPDSYYFAWEVCGAFALFGLLVTYRPDVVPARTALVNFLFIGLLLALTFWLVALSFYLDWTNVGLPYIEGVQGRYGLPLVPFLLFAVPGLRWRFRIPPLIPALPTIALGIYDLGYIPMKLVWNYYLH